MGNFDRNYYASSSSPAVKSSQPGGDKGKKTDEVVVPCSNNNDNNTRKDVEAGGKEQGKTKVKARSIMEIMKGMMMMMMSPGLCSLVLINHARHAMVLLSTLQRNQSMDEKNRMFCFM
ncbi:hypothetical protein Bca52824_009169 [Brassica carinata]|uniref:Uncharacterized protein n=1 Tax=Brassica carinata TaxID=52824 RepID=A0A8X7WB93_BRACI|nr:hypothetical protein Bca52824_009169 [Brassica carinata]